MLGFTWADRNHRSLSAGAFVNFCSGFCAVFWVGGPGECGIVGHYRAGNRADRGSGAGIFKRSDGGSLVWWD